ncbi:hypothetical protein ACI78Q_12140 [Geodermatophilus sp. SYSU D00705]
MAPTAPCTRHTRAWIAGCSDCTAWHLPRQIARRASTPASRTTRLRAVPSPCPRRTVPPAVVPVGRTA